MWVSEKSKSHNGTLHLSGQCPTYESDDVYGQSAAIDHLTNSETKHRRVAFPNIFSFKFYVEYG